MTRDHLDELLDHAVEVILPKSGTEDECRESIKKFIGPLRREMLRRKHPSPAEQKKLAMSIKSHALKLQRELAKLKDDTSFRRIYEASGSNKTSSAWADLETTLNRLKSTANFLAPDDRTLGLQIRPGSPSGDPVVYTAAGIAFYLIRDLSQSPPTLTLDGAYFTLTQLLVEAATGEPNISVDRACRRFFADERHQN